MTVSCSDSKDWISVGAECGAKDGEDKNCVKSIFILIYVRVYVERRITGSSARMNSWCALLLYKANVSKVHTDIPITTASKRIVAYRICSYMQC